MGEFRPSKPGERRGGRQKGTPNKTTASILAPIMERASEGHGIIRTTTGGAIDTWSLDNPIAGRGRKYHLIIIDEAAFTKESLNEIWESNLRPTLIDSEAKLWPCPIQIGLIRKTSFSASALKNNLVGWTSTLHQ